MVNSWEQRRLSHSFSQLRLKKETSGKVICKECKAEVPRPTFRKHLLCKHFSKLWKDIKEDETVCRYEDCKKEVENSKYLIQHMALSHDELDSKLKEIGKTVKDYVFRKDDKGDKEKEDNGSDADEEDNGSDATMMPGEASRGSKK